MMLANRVAAVLWMTSVMAVTPADGQQNADNESAQQPVNTFVAKQEMIRDRLARLEDRMFRLHEKLAETEPENASKLEAALRRSGELGVNERVDELLKIFGDGSRLDGAVDAQGQLLKDLGSILESLTERNLDDEDREQEIQRLEELKAKINDLTEKQRELRTDTGAATGNKRRAARLGQAIKRLDDIIRRQETLKKNVESPPSGQGAPSPSLEKMQSEIAKATKRLADDLKAMDASKSDGENGSPSKSPSASDGKSKPSKQGSPSKSGSKGDGSAESADAAKAAAKDLDSAQKQMADAQDDLKKDERDSAAARQKSAVEELRRARHRLKKEQEKLDDESGERRLADAQRKLSKEAKSLTDRMRADQKKGEQKGQQGGEQKQSPPGGEPQKGQSGGKPQKGQQGGKPQQGKKGEPQSGSKGGQQQSEQTPGQDQVEQAQKHMDDAADDLDDEDPAEATVDQDAALAELQDAMAELEDALKQLREEEQEEILRDLESRFRDMLATQLKINKGTSELHAIGRDNFKRAEELSAAELADGERQLAKDAATSLHVLEEEGTTVVFPAILEQLAGDMTVVANRLGKLNVGVLTQTLEDELVTTLQDLVAAIAEKLEDMKNQQGQSPSSAQQDQDQPLLPTSAELKLLKSMQVRVLKRTTVIDEERARGNLEKDELQTATRSATRRQKEAAEIAREMRELEEGS